MKTFIVALYIFIAVYPTNAQEATTDSFLLGIWKGTSLCQVHNSPCRDESVVYYISKVQGTDTFNIAANKIVDGQEEEMGVIGCKWDRGNNLLRSTSFNGLWTFNFKNNNLDGTLYYKGNLYRIIKLTKQK